MRSMSFIDIIRAEPRISLVRMGGKSQDPVVQGLVSGVLQDQIQWWFLLGLK
jgi:hypothetical protein